MAIAGLISGRRSFHPSGTAPHLAWTLSPVSRVLFYEKSKGEDGQVSGCVPARQVAFSLSPQGKEVFLTMVGVKLEPYHKGEGERVIRVEIGAPAEGSHAIKGAFFFSTHMAPQGYDADAASWREDKTTLVRKSHLLFNLCFLTSLRKYFTLFRYSQKQRHFKSFQSFLSQVFVAFIFILFFSELQLGSIHGGPA